MLVRPVSFVVALVVVVASLACSSGTANQVTTPTARCQVSLAAPPAFPAAGGTSSTSVVTARDCLWTAQVDAEWLTIEPASGQGETPLALSGTPNPRGTSRAATLTINEFRFTVPQEATPCRFDVTPTHADVAAQGARLIFTVSTIEGCSWTTETSHPWLRVVRNSGAEGTAELELNVDSNTGPERAGVLRIARIDVPITQAPRVEGSQDRCGYSLGSGAQDFGPGGGEGTVRVHTAAGCLWGATASQPWVTIVRGLNGSGTEDIRYRVEANPTGQRRSAVITVANRRHVVQQAPGPAPVG